MSRLLSVTGLPGRRRFTAASLRAALERAGVDVYRSETVSGVLPVCFVAGSPR